MRYKLFLFDEHFGDLFVGLTGGRETLSFSFSDEYLKKRHKIAIDPELEFYSGRQFSADVFGFINDLIPDRFGKALIREKERALARTEGRPPKKLSTIDYVLGVGDLTRMGAIRIQNDQGVFVCDDKDNVIPPYLYLRDIENASLEYEESGVFESDEYRRLLFPGSSLGGARPKANIFYNDELWMAKFPSKNDAYDVEAWEKLTYDLAGLCNINVCETRLETYSKIGSTLLLRRFDREGRKRIHYLSFMTVLGARDGDSSEYSFLDLASYLKSSCDNVCENLAELYRRLVFAFLVNNTDNHLRNHGLLFDGKGLTLSPMFDVNPSFEVGTFALPLTCAETSKSTIIEEGRYYGLDKKEASAVYESIAAIIADNYLNLAKKYKVRSAEVSLFEQILSTRK